MNKLILLIPFLTITMGVAFAQSEIDYLKIFNEGLELVNEGKSNEAMKKFDQVLENNPNNTHSLIAKGNLLAQQGRYLEAHGFFFKAFNIDTSDQIARNNINLVLKHLKNIPIEGSVEIQIRDPNGFLVSFVKTNPGQLRMLDDDIIKNFIQTWEIKDTFTRDDKKFEVRQLVKHDSINSNSVWGNTGLLSDKNPYYMVLAAAHWGFPVGIGDTIISTYTVIVPVG